MLPTYKSLLLGQPGALPDDWHVHLRDGPMLASVVNYTARQFARTLDLPNVRFAPPVHGEDLNRLPGLDCVRVHERKITEPFKVSTPNRTKIDRRGALR